MKDYLSVLLVVIGILFQPGCLTQKAKDARKYDFPKHYAFHSIPLWEQELRPYMGKPNLRFLEVGVGEGQSAIWMLEHVLTHPTAGMTGIDIFLNGEPEERFLSNIKKSGYAHKVKTIVGFSQEKLKLLSPNSFDIIYIDACHMAANVLTDAVLSWPLLKEGGLLIFDDYLMAYLQPAPIHSLESLPKDKKTRSPALPLELSPEVAIDAFITAHRNNLDVVYRGYQVILKKRENDTFFMRTNDFFGLSLEGYRYFWREKTLYRVQDRTKVSLSDQERIMIERLFLGRSFGETDFHPDDELLKDKDFLNLQKRLNLDFTKKEYR